MDSPTEKNPEYPGDAPAPAATCISVDDDGTDLAAAKAGDHEAFARLYDRHAPVVLSICRLAARGSLAEAEDATQETFIRAHRMLDNLRDPSKLRSWLYTIARRVSSERRRSTARRNTHEGQAMLNATARPHSAAAYENVRRNEELDRLTDAIEQLDEHQRLAVHLYYLEADPVRAAAEALGLSRSGYYKLLARARDRLACLMQEAPSS